MSKLSREFGNFAPVMAHCADADITIHEALVESARHRFTVESDGTGDWEEVDDNWETTTASHAAFAAAAGLIRQQGSEAEQLSSGLIRPAVAKDTVTRHVVSLLNSGHDPTLLAPIGRNFTGSTRTIDTCGLAELYFGEIFALVDANDDPHQAIAEQSKGFELFHDDQLQPWGIRKSGDVPSVMTLRPVSIDNRFFTAGSFAKIYAKGDWKQVGGTTQYRPAIDTGKIAMRSIDDIEAVSVMRLSMFASPPGDERYACTPYHVTALDKTGISSGRYLSLDMIFDTMAQLLTPSLASH